MKSFGEQYFENIAYYDDLTAFKIYLSDRYAFNNLKQDGNLLNIPVFLADWTKKIINSMSFNGGIISKTNLNFLLNENL